MNQTIKQVADYIKKYPSPISELTRLAQFVLETGAGTSQLFKYANNGFGIKASKPWQGEVTQHISPEGANSQIMVKSGFRKYPSMEASVKDHASFFTSTDHRKNVAYAKAIHATTLKDEMKALEGVYAGDMSYGYKLLKAVDDYNLRSYFEDGGTSKFRLSEAQKKGNDSMYIGIDIGHGTNTYANGGGKGVWKNGKLHEEHYFNSKVAIKLKALLEKAGHRVTYGVQNPNSLDTSLTSRSNKFNALGVDLVISIHANAAGGKKPELANGICIFYWNNDQRGLKLSNLILNDMKSKYKIHGEGAMACVPGTWTNFHMVRETKMLAILCELGFMTGNKDFDLIFGSKQEEYTTDMANSIFKGVQAYFGKSTSVPKTEPVKMVASDTHRVVKGDTLWHIANKYGTTVKQLKDLNGLTSDIISVGQMLKVKGTVEKIEPRPVKPVENKAVEKVVEKPTEKTEAFELEDNQELRIDSKGNIVILTK